MALRSYTIPCLKAVLIHVLVIAVFTFNWESDSDRELLVQPRVLQAKVLTMADPVAARKEAARKNDAARKKAVARKKAAANKKADVKSKLAAKKKADAKRKADAKKKADVRKKIEAKKKADANKKDNLKRKAEDLRRVEDKRQKAEAEGKRQEQLARDAAQRQQELAAELANELAREQAESDAIAAQSYEGLIRQRVMESWHIPLSARNGMKAVLNVNLLPTGEVINVAVVNSSGDEAFDRSAVQAVRRAEKFKELQQLEPRIFDANFRSFNFLFMPQDLD